MVAHNSSEVSSFYMNQFIIVWKGKTTQCTETEFQSLAVNF